jgi:hypothetical protein
VLFRLTAVIIVTERGKPDALVEKCLFNCDLFFKNYKNSNDAKFM